MDCFAVAVAEDADADKESLFELAIAHLQHCRLPWLDCVYALVLESNVAAEILGLYLHKQR